MENQERHFMELAVQEARKCRPEDSTHSPRVGAVAVRDGQVLGRAYREELGRGEHAEFTLLERKLRDTQLAGATVYTTLEPCTSRNPPKIPCVERLIERRVARVVIGQLDPNPDIRGKGQLLLRDAKISIGVFDNDLVEQVEELNRDFARAFTASATHGITTDLVYDAYSTLGPEDDLFAWVATWPAFPDTPRERILERCAARRMLVVGPVDRAIQLPGVFWRLDIRERRQGQSGLSPLFLFSKPVPPLKIIIAGSRAFLAPVPETRTTQYFDLGRSSDHLRELFLADLEGARTVEESVYLFLLRRLQELRAETLDSADLMRMFDEERQGANTFREAESYDPQWVHSLFCKWVPSCVRQVTQSRGWTALQVSRAQTADFELRLKPHGRWLVKPHDAHLRFPKDMALLLPSPRWPALPKLRIVVTNRCDLGCRYCPPENEDFPGGFQRHTMAPSELALLIRAALRCGFLDFAITGGEPLSPTIAGDGVVRTLHEVRREAAGFGAKFAIQTNGEHLKEYLGRLEDIRDCLVLKVSVDAVDDTDGVAKSMIASRVLESIRSARSLGFMVGVDFVLTKDTSSQLAKVARWCSREGPYLKILDLNWYADIGKRSEGRGATDKGPSGDLFWEEQYMPTLAFYLENLRDTYGDVRIGPTRYGVPMLETARQDNGFFIRIRDSSLGSHYAADCRVCPYFVDRRRCQEGIYQPWITPSLRLKVCRHRPDVQRDLGALVSDGKLEETAAAMQEMLQRFYAGCKYVPLSGGSA